MTIEKLIKCLEMMSSDSDGEALNASRKATKILKSMNLRWCDVIKAKQPDPPKAQPAHNSPAHGGMHGNMHGFAQGMGGQYGNPFAQQQYNQQGAWNAQQEFMRQQEMLREQMFRGQAEMNRRAKAKQDAQKTHDQEVKVEPTLDLKEKENAKRKAFWRLGA